MTFNYPTYDIDLLQSLAGNEEKLASYLEEKNEEFEKDLVKHVSDPLSRAEQRREWYSRDRELRSELLTEIVVETEKPQVNLNDRTFLAFGDQNYHATLLSEELEKTKQEIENFQEEEFSQRIPIFLGQKNQFYDINYIPFGNEEDILAEKRGKWTDIFETTHDEKFIEKNIEKMSYEYIHDPELYQNPPDPESFSDFDDYETALLEWRDEVEKALGFVQLPRVLGRHQYRPYVLPEEEQKASQKQKELFEEREVKFGFIFFKKKVSWENYSTSWTLKKLGNHNLFQLNQNLNFMKHLKSTKRVC
jgi:hypothetical protein